MPHCLCLERAVIIHRESNMRHYEVVFLVHPDQSEQVPAMIELYVLPDDILAQNPTTKFYKYTVVQDRVVLVDPTNMRIVAVIQASYSVSCFFSFPKGSCQPLRSYFFKSASIPST